MDAWVGLFLLFIAIVIVAVCDTPDKWGERFEEDKGKRRND